MATPANTVGSLNIGLLAARLPIGAVFIFAAVSKFSMGVGKFVEMSLPSAQKFMPDSMGRLFLHGLPYIEMVLGVLVVVGAFTRLSGFFISLLLISFMIAVTGVGAVPNAFPFSPNLLLLGNGILLMLCGGGWISVDGLIHRRAPLPKK